MNYSNNDCRVKPQTLSDFLGVTNDVLQKWKRTDDEDNAAIEADRKQRIRDIRMPRCPHCKADAMELWHIYGQQYFKCRACGKRA